MLIKTGLGGVGQLHKYRAAFSEDIHCVDQEVPDEHLIAYFLRPVYLGHHEEPDYRFTGISGPF